MIRRAIDRDAASISTLMRAAILHNNARDYPRHVIERLLFWHSPGAVGTMLGERHVVVAEDAGCVIATVALEAAVLRGLFVAVDHQGRGIAAELVRHVEAIAGAAEIASLSLQSSLTAHGFYEKLGYRTQAFRYHPEGSTYRMIKRL